MRSRGFTLIELSVALAIAGLLIAVAIPGLARLYARVQFNASVAELTSGISALPRVAFALGEEGTLSDLAARHLEIPHEWTLVGAERIYIRSSGLCAGGPLRIVTPGGERELELEPPFCRVASKP
jgi:prepilin-type N-terminal cleavage/methylation domain-containing protein